MSLQTYNTVRELASTPAAKLRIVEGSKDKKCHVLKQVTLDPKDKKGTTSRFFQAIQETRMLFFLRHRHVIELKDFFVAGDNFNIVMEYCEKGDLSKQIVDHINRKEHFHQDQILMYFTQICEGIAFAHDMDIIHRDIKPQNIFVATDTCVKVGDFGVCKVLQSQDEVVEGARAGTRAYMAPEVYNKEKYTNKADVWGVGVVLFEMLTLAVPHVGFTDTFEFDKIPSGYAPIFRELCEMMLKHNADERPSIRQVLDKIAAAGVVPSFMQKSTLAQPGSARAGVGLVFEPDYHGALHVVDIAPGGAAAQNGLIHLGDVVVEVNGIEVHRRPIGTITEMILGPPGTPVNIVFQRGMDVVRVTLTRGETAMPSSEDRNNNLGVAAAPPPLPPAVNRGQPGGLPPLPNMNNVPSQPIPQQQQQQQQQQQLQNQKKSGIRKWVKGMFGNGNGTKQSTGTAETNSTMDNTSPPATESGTADQIVHLGNLSAQLTPNPQLQQPHQHQQQPPHYDGGDDYNQDFAQQQLLYQQQQQHQQYLEKPIQATSVLPPPPPPPQQQQQQQQQQAYPQTPPHHQQPQLPPHESSPYLHFQQQLQQQQQQIQPYQIPSSPTHRPYAMESYNNNNDNNNNNNNGYSTNGYSRSSVMPAPSATLSSQSPYRGNVASSNSSYLRQSEDSLEYGNGHRDLDRNPGYSPTRDYESPTSRYAKYSGDTPTRQQPSSYLNEPIYNGSSSQRPSQYPESTGYSISNNNNNNSSNNTNNYGRQSYDDRSREREYMYDKDHDGKYRHVEDSEAWRYSPMRDYADTKRSSYNNNPTPSSLLAPTARPEMLPYDRRLNGSNTARNLGREWDRNNSSSNRDVNQSKRPPYQSDKQWEKDDVDGRIGVGLVFQEDSEEIFVIGTIPGSPADDCKMITGGDCMYEVDGVDVYKQPFSLLKELVLGHSGTEVVVGVKKHLAKNLTYVRLRRRMY